MLEKGLKHISRTVVQRIDDGIGRFACIGNAGFGSIDGKCGNVGRSG